MKNFLIPTNLQEDVITAVKNAIKLSNGENTQVILMLVSEIPDTYSANYLLRNLDQGLTPSQENSINICRAVIAETNNCKLKIHHQYGISAAIFRNLIAHFEIGLTIISPSFQISKKRINQICFKTILNNKCPVLLTTEHFEEEAFTNGMFIKKTKSSLQAEDIQKYFKNVLPLKSLSQTKIDADLDAIEIAPVLTDTITKNNINLIIETRKPEKLKLLKKEKAALNELLGIPVLSIYEEAS